MEYTSKNYEDLLGIKGLSDTLLKNHLTLYQGYVTNTNKLSASIFAMAKEGKAGTPEFAELKRRFGWEFNGMRLHELYFENISKEGNDLGRNSELFRQINADFEGFDNFLKDFKGTGSMRGIGWVILYYDTKAKKLFNAWINEHDVGHLSGAVPILVMDAFEHAYMIDYGLKKTDYIETFFSAVDWQEAEKRFLEE